MLSVERVVDTTTGKEIRLPVPKIERVYFRADGTMIIINGADGYLVADGAIVAHQKLAVDGLMVIRYVV